jgi:hypothetical protein
MFSRPHHLVIFKRRFDAKKGENPVNKTSKLSANISFRNHIEDGIPGIAKKSVASNNRGASPSRDVDALNSDVQLVL